jgi:hypothetical protein
MQCRFTIAVFALLAALAGAAAPACAQEEGSGTSFITPFPLGDIYRVHVIGDDLADGLLYGLNEAFVGDGRLQLRPQHYSINGLMRADFAQKLAQLDADLERDPVNIAIVMMGAWDRVSVRDASGRRVPVGSEAWRTEYGARADRLIKTLKKRNIAVYWVGLPNVRRFDANEDVQMMNNIVRERTYLNGFKYIDAYTGFMDETGGYSPYGPDVTGKIRVLRSGDGVYFTGAGNRKLAHFVERDLRRDLTQAKADRAIPLAGTEEEQAKINPDKAKLAEPAAQGGAAAAARAEPSAPGTPAAAVAQAGSASGDQKADNGKINLRIIGASGRDEVVTLDIVRPPIPASVVALVTRRESVDRPSQIGEAIIDQIPGGLTVMSTVALSNTPGAGGTRSRLSPAQTPYFRVLFKGERLMPKPGRADDITWPRPEPAADTAAVLPESEDGALTTGATPAPVPAKRPARDADGRRRE